MHVAATTVPGGAVPARGAATAAAAAPRPPPRAAATPPRATTRTPASPAHTAQPTRSAATAAAAAAAAPGLAEACPVSAAAFATALDAGAELPDSWLSHWRQQEAKREARRALIGSTRGRQQQRLRHVATLLSGGSLDLNGGGSSSAAAAAAGLGQQPASSSSGGSLEAAEELYLSGGGMDMEVSMDLPPLQQMSELDELTWLASHPPESEAASSSSGDGSSSGESSSGDGSGMQLWAAAGRPQQGQHAGQQAAQQAQRHPGHIVGLAGSAAEGRSPAELQGPLQLRVGSDLLSVRPLWIAIYQPEEGGPAKLFESVSPLLPDLVGRLSSDIAPFCSISGLRFGPADAAAGPWRNFFVGLVGAVAADEDDILWPNQVLHRDRVLFNVRNGWDVAKFLSEPAKEDVEQHRENLLRLAAERGYRRGWCWHMLRLRWGEATLKAMGLDKL